jgi:fucose 4-O-acetylase-like acetyltransferase
MNDIFKYHFIKGFKRNMTHRIEHIDIAKGISILLVVLFHSQLNAFYPNLIESMGIFRMPLFFFVSGIFFNASIDTFTFLWKKADALLKPYFVTLFVILLITVLFQDIPWLWHLKGIFYANGWTIMWTPMWFLTHLFVVYCFTYGVFKVTKIQEQSLLVKFIFIFVLLTIGTHWIDLFFNIDIHLFGKTIKLPGLPFSFDLIFVTSSFFMVGIFLKKSVIEMNTNVYYFFFLIVILIAINILTDAKIGLHTRRYINPFIATLGATCGIYIVLCCSIYFSKVKILRKIFLLVGQASLFILIFHDALGLIVYNYLIEWGGENFNLLFAVMAYVISIVGSLIIRLIIINNKLLSWCYLPIKVK